MLSLVSSQVQAEPPQTLSQASAVHESHEDEPEVQQKQVRWTECFWRQIIYDKCCIFWNSCVIFLILDNSTKETGAISSCCTSGWGGGRYLCHLLWAVDQCWGAPSVCAALWAPLWLHLHWEVAQGTGREVPSGKMAFMCTGKHLKHLLCVPNFASDVITVSQLVAAWSCCQK